MLKVGLTYDLRSDYLAMGLSEEETAEFDSEVTVAGLEGALTRLGFKVERIGHVKALAARLVAGERWDFVFNICEGLKGLAREAQVPALLEAYDIPYTFSDPLTLSAGLDKAMSKRIARAQGVPTPDFALVETEADLARIDLPYPLFAKPVAEGSGKGVSARSRCTSKAELKAEVVRLRAKFQQPVLVEAYLPGREFTVGVTGTGANARVLGLMEVLPQKSAEAYAYGYENKENYEGRIEYAVPDDDEAKRAAAVALAAHRAMRCRDASRSDIRSDSKGEPHFIEINPLAGLNPEKSDLVFITRFVGLSYDDLIARIVESLFERESHLKARHEKPKKHSGSA